MPTEIIVDDSELGPALNAWTERTIQAMKVGVGRATAELVDYVRNEKLAGQVLFYRSGNLWFSVRQAMEQVLNDQVSESVIAGGQDVGVPYAHIHEYGGTIRPVSASMLHWVDQAGKDIFAHEVHIPERPFMRPSLEEMKGRIVSILQEELASASSR